MATCHDVIEDALSELGVYGPGQSISAEDAATALVLIQSAYDGLVTTGMFGRAVEVIEDAAYTAEESDRVYNSTGSNLTITLPETVTDADSGDERPPRDLTIVRVAGATRQTYIYSSAFGAWQRMTSLELTDTAPLAERDLHGLSCLLATRLARRFKATLDQATVAYARAFTASLALKFDAPRVIAQAEYY